MIVGKIELDAGLTKPKLESVQWLRAIAAILVVIHHALYYTDAMQQVPVESERTILGFSSWWIGIHIFFVVSGFIMINASTGYGTSAGGDSF